MKGKNTLYKYVGWGKLAGKQMNIKFCRYVLNIVGKASKTSVRPAIKFEKLEAMGINNPYMGEIILNKKLNSCILKPIFLKKYLRHELKHAEQFQIMARYFAGKEKSTEEGLCQFRKMLGEKLYNNSSIGFLNEKYYDRVIKKDGVIIENTPLYEKAEAYIKAFKEYPDMSKALEKQSNQSFWDYIINLYKVKKSYKSNLLEKEAVSASKNK